MTSFARCKIWASQIESQAERQLRNVAQLPIIHHHVAAMPDAHCGIGATVGSVLTTRSAIIPAAVGVNIGCGMIAARLSLTANDLDEASLRRVFDQISRDVPVGRGQHRGDLARVEAAKVFEPGLNQLTTRHPQLLRALGKFSNWIAREDMLRLDAQLPDRDLAYFEEDAQHFDHYVEAVS